MPRTGGVYSPPAGTKGVSNTTIQSVPYNAFVDDLTADANAARPITAGGTGATSASGARTALGLGTAAVKDIGTSGNTVPVLDGSNRFSGIVIVEDELFIDSDGNRHLWLRTAAGLVQGLVYSRASDGAMIIQLRNGAGVVTKEFILPQTGSITFGSDTVWTSGNDGSGSGLDADLLDGMNTSAAGGANTIGARDGVGNFNARDLTADRGNHTGILNFGAATDGVRLERTAGGLNLVGAQLAAASFTQAATDSSTNIATTAYVTSRFAESSQLTLTLGGVVSFTHGLGAEPKEFWAVLVNQTTEFSYAVGSKINVRSDNIGTAAGHGIELIPNATTVDARIGNTSIGKALDAGSGAAVTLTTANWKVILRARL